MSYVSDVQCIFRMPDKKREEEAAVAAWHIAILLCFHVQYLLGRNIIPFLPGRLIGALLPFAGPPPNAQLLKKAAEYVEGMLRVMGISTIGLHLTEDLSISSEQLLKIFRQFRDCTSTAPHLQEVSPSLRVAATCHVSFQPYVPQLG